MGGNMDIKKQYLYMFESLSVWSKDYNRTIFITANNNIEAQKLCLSYNFEWSCMSRFINK
jgi:hypothetical protein